MTCAKDLYYQIGKVVKKEPRIGDHSIRYDKLVLVCKKCHKPIVAEGKSYHCSNCNKYRNVKQRFWMSIESHVEFRLVDEDLGVKL